MPHNIVSRDTISVAFHLPRPVGNMPEGITIERPPISQLKIAADGLQKGRH